MSDAAPDTEVLELGCGTGRVLLTLAEKCKHIQGVDYSAAMIDKCRRKIKGSNVSVSKASLAVGDISQLDLGQKYDLVIAPFRVMQALETDEEVEGFLSSVKRHMAPGASAEGRRGGSVTATAKEQVDLDEDGPGNERVSAEPGEEALCEPVAPAFRAIDGRENGTRVADGHARTRARISSTLRERSGSSSINPA